MGTMWILESDMNLKSSFLCSDMNKFSIYASDFLYDLEEFIVNKSNNGKNNQVFCSVY